jgi:hypothetical protein
MTVLAQFTSSTSGPDAMDTLNSVILGAGAAAPYLGQVATNCYAPIQLVTGSNSLNSVTTHFLRAPVNGAVRFRFPWYYLNAAGWETSTSLGAATVKAYLEYPTGTLTPITFSSGAATGNMSAGGVVWSDDVAITMPANATFRIRTYVTSATAGIALIGRGSASQATGGGLAFGTNLADQSANAAYNPGNGWNQYGPDAIVSLTTRRSFLLLGDSREQELPAYGDKSLDFGLLGRSLGPRYAFSGIAVSGGAMNVTDGTPAARANTNALAPYFTDVILEFGYNDRAFNTTQINGFYQTWYTSLKAANPNILIGQTTIFSGTSSAVATGGLTSSGTTATVTVTAAQAAQLWVGQTIRIAGVTPAGYNGDVAVTAISGTTVSYTLLAGATGLAASSVNGTISDLWQSKDTHVFQGLLVGTDNLAAVNRTTRQSRPQVDYFIEQADFFDDGRDTRYVKPNLLGDGIHPSHFGSLAYKQSGGALEQIPGLR